MNRADAAAEIRRRLAQGRNDEAGELARELAAADPSDPAAWCLLAKAMVGAGKAAEAQLALERAAGLGSLPPDAVGDLAAAHLLRGDLEVAGRLIARAIGSAPNHPVLWHRKAMLEERRGDVAAAEGACRKALAFAPGDADLHRNHGLLLRRLGRDEAAAHAFRGAIALAPEREDLRLALIATLRATGRIDQALLAARDAGAAIRGSAHLMAALSAVLLDAGEAETALQAARSAIERQPDHAEAWLHAGNALRLLGRWEGAAEAYRKLLAAVPDDVQGLANLGLALQAAGDAGQARQLAQRAVTLAPADAEARHAAGTIAEAAGDLVEAERHFREATRLRPGYAEAHFSLGSLLLSQGRLREGQPGFDRRWHLRRFDRWRRPFDRPPIDRPMWDGSALAGRSLLVWGDHGPGEEILYSRLIDRVAASGGPVILECDPRLVSLLTRAFPAVAVVPRSDPPHPATRMAELQCPAGSLAGRLHVDASTLPRPRPTPLRAETARARELRGKYQDGRLLVGISWHASIRGEKDDGLVAWLPILRVPACRFVSVQHGDQQAEFDALRRSGGVAILSDPEIDPQSSLDAAAAQIAALDLVITVSGTAAHLSAALGVPTWTMVPRGPSLSWYWFLDRDDSPWYPTMRLYRQTAEKDWSDVIGRVASDLTALRQG